MFWWNLILHSTFVVRIRIPKFWPNFLCPNKVTTKSKEKFLKFIVNKQNNPGPLHVGCNEEYCTFCTTLEHNQVWVSF